MYQLLAHEKMCISKSSNSLICYFTATSLASYILREVATLRRTEEQESGKTESHSSLTPSYAVLVPLDLPSGTD